MRGAFGLLLLVLWCAATNAEQAPRIAGAAQTQFSWQSARCDTWDIPDTPARAWRVAGGLVHLVAGAERSRAMVGPSLSQTQRTCQSVFAATGQDDPAAWDDRGWIAATFTPDGQQVIALAHMEYHGHLRRDRCPLGSYADCWYNGVIEVQSQDGGHSFTRIGGGADLVAALPVRFQGDAGRRLGYFNPSNIVQRGDRLYAFVFAEAFGLQRRGPCLFSRPVAGSAADWRAWDGNGFTVQFSDPYGPESRQGAIPACTPVLGLIGTISSVVEQRGTGTWLALTSLAADGQGRVETGIYWATSRDLVHWTKPRLLFAVPLFWRPDCTAPSVFAYPSALDEGDPGRNFQTVGPTFWLYLVQAKLGPDCRIGPDRDLIRLPVIWPGPVPSPATEPEPAVAVPDPRQ
jgi:hypothetical protein